MFLQGPTSHIHRVESQMIGIDGIIRRNPWSQAVAIKHAGVCQSMQEFQQIGDLLVAQLHRLQKG